MGEVCMTQEREKEGKATLHGPIRRVVWRAILLGLVALGGILWYGQKQQPRVWGERPLDQMGHFGTVPDFALTERRGQRVTRQDLQGLVWVAHFFYTSCPDTCPLQSAKMARLQRDLANEQEVRLVSISIDPEHDTPNVLMHYARRFGADPERWLFLTGNKATIYHLAQDGFHLSVVDPGEPPRPVPPSSAPGERSDVLPRPAKRYQDVSRQLPSGARVTPLPWQLGSPVAVAHTGGLHTPLRHSPRFVLVDRQARIRGYYHSDEAAAMQRLRREVRVVLQEP
jgi:cytochrome oxidase Cu insertion factor (SCO1/SenC/PrrC family)